MSADATEVFQGHRPVLFGVAYRMLGRVADAEDVVQEAWLRWSAADRAQVREPRGYLVRVTTRLALDRLRQVRSRREAYVGSWLPEPLVTDLAPAAAREHQDGAERAMRAESVSVALLVVLESLSPLERAVFVLREAFGFPFAEIAGTLERSEAAVRQLAGRARRHVAERKPRFDVDPGLQRDLTERFLAAAVDGDLDGLLRLLAPDVRLLSDSAGKAKAPRRVIDGADKVGRFLAAVGPQAVEFSLGFRFLELNGAQALLATHEGRADTVFALDVAGGLIQAVYLIRNPDKLAHLHGAAAGAGEERAGAAVGHRPPATRSTAPEV
ncbi:RNA polymerase sigma factor SigJ [Streptomyces reniochalinae]|uniref:RNA polymerase sigma-70 factor n=1 Tax=Streptomyces reniochalinae TaxID=2250578 RepID=A0A367E747_9ACTN|nr:RNA polymerase sigma factor SigJ [Streptomyces reniochalinae]RCG13854.1 RNA polymerase sigma-70 factor [Streptomyces reniochalinae]